MDVSGVFTVFFADFPITLQPVIVALLRAVSVGCNTTVKDFDRFFYFLLQIRGWRWVVGGRNKSTVGWGWGRRFGGRRVEYHGWWWKRTLKTDGGRTGGAGGTNSELCRRLLIAYLTAFRKVKRCLCWDCFGMVSSSKLTCPPPVYAEKAAKHVEPANLSLCCSMDNPGTGYDRQSARSKRCTRNARGSRHII